ncbi:MAG: spermine synthase [Candidatus Omnitrophota bacterium]
MLAAIFIVGLSGIVAQIVILRELLVNFYGNELTVGIILANWVMLEAAGVFLFGRIIERIGNKLNAFLLLNISFALFLPFCVYFARVFKGAAGIPFNEAVSLSVVFVSSMLVILPPAFLHGALFSSGCQVHALSAGPERSLGRVYAWEALGTIIGGLLLAYLLIPLLDSFRIVLSVSFLNFGLSFALIPAKRIRYFALGILLFLFVLFFTAAADCLQRSSIRKQWQGQQVLDYRNSDYANIVVTKNPGQYTVFSNGIPVIVTPFPDRQFTEEFANFPLLFHGRPGRVLVAGSGIGGLIAEALKYPLQQVDYVEVDPLIIDMLKKYPTPLSEKELGDQRVKVRHTDPRLFLRESAGSYDVVLLGFSNQADLSSNRFFTREFFALVRRRLAPDGLFALWMNGSLTYLSPELRELNNSILKSLESVYRYVRVIPGDYNIFIASDSGAILSAGAGLISARIAKDNIPVSLLIPDYLAYRLGPDRLDWFNLQMSRATGKLNRDLQPAAVYETLKITNKKFSPRFSRAFEYLDYLNLRRVSFFIFLAAVLLLSFSRRLRNRKIPLVYTIFTTGFFGMLATLLLVFAYQVFYGYLYRNISALTAVFMAGVAA